MGWSLCNGLRILIDVTPSEVMVRNVVRDLIFNLGDGEANPLSVDGAIKQENTSVNALLHLRRREDTREPSRLLRDFAVHVKGATNGFL